MAYLRGSIGSYSHLEKVTKKHMPVIQMKDKDDEKE
jgi:hypothetical protein